jgi:tryptophanyl-tRNA synthetase
MKGRIFSGIKPSGNLHLGNYLGAIRNWVRLQGDYDAIYCVVDQHAITVPQDPATLRERSIEIAAGFLASGLDAEKNAIFVQSHVAAHAQLAWVFNCLTPLGWLNRMTQFKDKAGKHREQASAGLYTYPTLMAADILHPGRTETQRRIPLQPAQLDILDAMTDRLIAWFDRVCEVTGQFVRLTGFFHQLRKMLTQSPFAIRRSARKHSHKRPPSPVKGFLV